ncbi:hypothetical protein JMN32_14245 [Fulvivirga sp. 29W222]|uniref:Uncharacterized protein n=1 Tax=Fulvivirga marina TaxID=2494733 RepID=A0A937FWJ5_9BACT|nr:hypothetical protein [Fulvivirga marina]MBL6447475.1 hypothetical protein [Fulvivirga marina]
MHSFRLSLVRGYRAHRFVLLLGSLLLLGVILPGVAQNDHLASPQAILPSSEAIALARQVAIPTGSYTGVPNISIPVYALTGKDISLPLSLRYHSVLDREASAKSWVGEDWVLEGAGVITRVINGISDFDANGYVGSNLPANLAAASSTYINQAISGTTDTGPDIFYFNFAGYKGSFAFTPQGELITDPSNHLKIEPLANENGEWIIRDAQGYQYTFGGTNGMEHISKDGVNKLSVTSWYLTKITSPLKEEVVLNYGQAIVVENGYYSDLTLPGEFKASFANRIANQKLDLARYHFVPYLESITLDNGTYGNRLTFQSRTTEAGSPFGGSFTKILEKVIVEVKDSADWKQTGHVSLTIGDGNLSSVYHYHSEVIEQTNDPSGPFNPLPSPENASVRENLISATKVSYTTIDGNRMLSEVQYNSGKKIKYFYEPHDFSNYTIASEDLQKLKLGYRLEHVAVEGAEPLETYFHYEDDLGNSSGTLYNFKNFDYTIDRWYKDGSYSIVNGPVTNNHVTPLFTTVLGGPMVTYSSIWTESPGKGKASYEYTEPVLTTTQAEGYYNQSFAPFLSGLDFTGGKLKGSKVYKYENNTWQVVQHVTRTYEEQSRPALSGLNLLMIDAAGDKNVVNAAATISGNNSTAATVTFRDITGMQAYQIPTTWTRMSQSTETYSETAGISKTTTTSFEYNNQNFTRKTTTLLANGVSGYSTISYPFEYTGEPVYDEMVSRNMLAYPVEALTYRKEGATELLTGGAISDYGFFADNDPANDQPDMVNENILVKATYHWENQPDGATPESEIPTISNKNYKLGAAFEYDVHGNLIQTSGKHKVAATVWDYKNELPIASVENAYASDVYFNGFEEDGTKAQAKTGQKSHSGGQFTIPFTPDPNKDYILTYWYYSSGQWYYREKPFAATINEGEALDEVRVYPEGARVTTTAYDWKGNVISATDTNDQSVYYDYNKMNQVTNVRNNDRDIIQTTQHNYAYFATPCEGSEIAPIQASFSGGDNMTVGVGAYFTLSVDASGGCGKYYFNWYTVDTNNNQNYLGTTVSGIGSSTSVQLKALCKDFFTVKCEVIDETGTGLVSIKKYIKVDVENAEMTLSLSGGPLYPYNYCTVNSDQIAVTPSITGGCGTYTYSWSYSYYNENTSGTITSTDEVFVEKFLGAGSLTCTVTDISGLSATVTQTISQDKDCLN